MLLEVLQVWFMADRLFVSDNLGLEHGPLLFSPYAWGTAVNCESKKNLRFSGTASRMLQIWRYTSRPFLSSTLTVLVLRSLFNFGIK